MNEKDLKELFNKLIDFATLPCDVEEQCKGCEIGYYCSMLYHLSRGLKGELTIDEVVDKINIEYKNIKWEERGDGES